MGRWVTAGPAGPPRVPALYGHQLGNLTAKRGRPVTMPLVPVAILLEAQLPGVGVMSGQIVLTIDLATQNSNPMLKEINHVGCIRPNRSGVNPQKATGQVCCSLRAHEAPRKCEEFLRQITNTARTSRLHGANNPAPFAASASGTIAERPIGSTEGQARPHWRRQPDAALAFPGLKSDR
jgi:hypothetical protein